MRTVNFALLFLCICLSLFIFDPVHAAVGDWKTIASVMDIRDTVIKNKVIWAATSGGILVYDTQTGQMKKITNTDGIVANDVSAIAVDQRGNIWAGFNSGLINRYNANTDQWQVVDYYSGQKIYRIQPFGDSLFIALDIGLSLYEINPNHVKETYTSLGRQLPVEIPVYSVAFRGREIWVGTDKGIAKSSLDLPNLMDPASWQNYTTFAGTNAEKIYALQVTKDGILAGSNDGIFRFDGQSWSQMALAGLDVLKFRSVQDTVYAVFNGGVFRYRPGGSWTQVGPGIYTTTALELSDPTRLWLGTNQHGLLSYDANGNAWSKIDLNCPGGNLFYDLALDSRGVLWCASYGSGIFRFDGVKWTNFSTANGLNINVYRAVAIDKDGRAWFGSEGKGITIIEEIDDQFQLTFIDQADGRITGADNYPTYILIEDIAVDAIGNVWIANRYADNNQALAVRTPADSWTHFSIVDGLRSNIVTKLFVDSYNRVWVGTTDKGLSVLDYRQTLFDKSDDKWDIKYDQSNNLESNTITTIAEDLEEIVWIGTIEGLNYWFRGQIATQYNLINYNINEIKVDVRNNKWVGTKGGLSILAPDGISWTHYTENNSPIPSNNVLAFAFNENTGTAYIGTDKGLAILQTPYTRPKANLSEIRGYPNPFLIGSTEKIFTIDNLADDASVRIYTESGIMVRNISQQEIPGSQARWDGRNDRGDWVASGIYVYLVFTENGQSATGKVAVIRE